ncbi:hypothetical protein PG984_015329 [Apiospora sp. TS-2023a]
MNEQVGEGFTENDVESTHKLYGFTPDGTRKAFDDYDFKTMVADWEKGTVKLLAQEDGGREYFEFENTKLQRENGVLPSVEEEPEEGANEGGGGGRHAITDERLRRASEAREQPEQDQEQRETPISTEDAEKQTQVLQMISSEDKNRRLDEFTYWGRVWRFFDFQQTIFDRRAKQLPGLRRLIDNYQLAAVFWLLTRYAVDGIAGAILGDDPGLGKTVIMIVTIKVHNDVQEAWADVMKFWKRAGSAEFKHIGKGAAEVKGIACPSQKEIRAKYGIQCPCVPGSDSQKIAESMHNWPSIIVGLPGQGIVTWTAEWNETIGPDSRLQLYVNDRSWTGHSQLADFIKAIEEAPMPEGVHRLSEVNRPVSKWVYGFEGGSRHVLLTSHYNITRLFKSKEGPVLFREHKKAEDQVATVAAAGCAILALDEVHRYRGDKSKKSEAIKLLLNHFGRQKTKPTLGVAVSGSLGSLGPGAWWYMLWHTLAKASRDTREQLGRFQNEEDFKKVDVDWKYLQAHIDDHNAEQQNPFKECLGRLRGDWTVMSKMFLRRGQRDEFMTRRIVDIPEPRHETVPLAMPENDTRRHVIEIFRTVRIHMEQVSEKDNTMLAVAQRKVLQAKVTTGEALNYTRYMATFPDIPFLAEEDNTIVPFLNSDKNLGGLASQFSRATMDPTPAHRAYEHINEKLQENNPFWAKVTTLRQHSPKMTHLEHLIKEELIGSKWKKRPAKRQLDKGPEDDSYVRHMIIFVRSPISAYLTALAIHYALGEQVDVFLLHSDIKVESTAKGQPWHSRKGFQETFNANCARNSKNKIAVMTYEMGATGWNLQRASVAVLLEVAARPEDRNQACNRVARRGQVCVPQIFELYYTNHWSEDQQKRLNDGIKEVKEIDWEDYGVTDQEVEEESGEEVVDEDN